MNWYLSHQKLLVIQSYGQSSVSSQTHTQETKHPVSRIAGLLFSWTMSFHTVNSSIWACDVIKHRCQDSLQTCQVHSYSGYHLYFAVYDHLEIDLSSTKIWSVLPLKLNYAPSFGPAAPWLDGSMRTEIYLEWISWCAQALMWQAWTWGVWCGHLLKYSSRVLLIQVQKHLVLGAALQLLGHQDGPVTLHSNKTVDRTIKAYGPF